MTQEEYQRNIMRQYSLKNPALVLIYAKYDTMIKFYGNIKNQYTIMKGQLNLFYNHDYEIDPGVSCIELSLRKETTIKKFLKSIKTPEVMESEVYKFKWLRLEEITTLGTDDVLYRVFIEATEPVSTKFYIDIVTEPLSDVGWAMEDELDGMHYSMGREVSDRFIKFVEYRSKGMTEKDYQLIASMLPKSNEFSIANSLHQLLDLKNFSEKHIDKLKNRWISYPFMNNKKYKNAIGHLMKVMAEYLDKQ